MVCVVCVVCVGCVVCGAVVGCEVLVVIVVVGWTVGLMDVAVEPGIVVSPGLAWPGHRSPRSPPVRVMPISDLGLTLRLAQKTWTWDSLDLRPCRHLAEQVAPVVKSDSTQPLIAEL